jgi:hypothetical protein
VGSIPTLNSKQREIVMKLKYSVWVGGSEVNDYYLTKDQAEALAYEYKIKGYTDVQIEEIITA